MPPGNRDLTRSEYLERARKTRAPEPQFLQVARADNHTIPAATGISRGSLGRCSRCSAAESGPGIGSVDVFMAKPQRLADRHPGAGQRRPVSATSKTPFAVSSSVCSSSKLRAQCGMSVRSHR
jgi:hypothetical protein